MKICLINSPPNFSGISHESKISTFKKYLNGQIESRSSWPPLGVLYIGTIIKEGGYEVSVLDAAAKGWPIDKILEWVKNESPDVIGLSALTPSFVQAMEIARRSKELLPDVKIIVGGYHVTFAPAKTLNEFPFIDVIVRGEGEETILEILNVLNNGGKLSGISGISYLNNQQVVHTPSRSIKKDIDKLPFPDRGLIEDEYTGEIGGFSTTAGRFTTVITSRGCPYSCTFCACSSFRGRICSFRSPENVVDELEDLVSKGYEDIGIVDDNFMLDKKRVEKICELIKNRRLKFYWWCEGRVDNANYDILKKMENAGCRVIYYGVESANKRILKYYKKGTTPQQSINAVEAAKKAGLNVLGTFVVGAPIETKDEVLNTLNFVKKLNIDLPQINILGVAPGMAIWNELVANNKKIESEHWKTGFRPVEMNMCEYSSDWLMDAIHDTNKEFFNFRFLIKEGLKTFRSPYRLKILLRNF
jgi:anaerobic magnesium-protoporphyrin IX monomethyl ester cyclase